MTRFGTIAAIALLATSARGATVHFADEANGDYRIVGASDIEIDGQTYDYVIEETTLRELPEMAWSRVSLAVFQKVPNAIDSLSIPVERIGCRECWPTDAQFVHVTLEEPFTTPAPEGFRYFSSFLINQTLANPGSYDTINVSLEHGHASDVPDFAFDQMMDAPGKYGYAVLVPEPSAALLLLLGIVSMSWGRAR